ncbi:MAG: NAD-dependent epimerase/dehydratase family protein [Gemmatimonadota bacterium]|nr:MAG: NAD-dependent epimerase/dehydratase family protein [Gemmatimonadota bacterium]
MKCALVVGCGYSGERLGGRLLELGYRVVGTTRSEERAALLESAGIEPLVGDLQAPGTVAKLAELDAEVVFHLAPPQGEDKEPLAQVLEAVARPALQAFIYASSTSVYGDWGGQWVDETTEVDPASVAGRERRLAEDAVVELGDVLGISKRICRITGIYGPGRTLRGALESGRYKLISGRDTWVNRVHVDDLVRGLLAAWQRGSDGRVYNLVDAEPHRASEFANLAADLHGLAQPDWIGEEEARRIYGEAQLRRKLDSKRVRSVRLGAELGVELKYPNYRVGLPAAIAEEREERLTGARRGRV